MAIVVVVGDAVTGGTLAGVDVVVTAAGSDSEVNKSASIILYRLIAMQYSI